MKVWRDYRVTIPAKIRRELGLYPGTEVDFVVNGGTIEIVKAAVDSSEEPTKRISKVPKKNQNGAKFGR